MTDLARRILFLIFPQEQLKAVPEVSKGRKTGKQGKKCPTTQQYKK
jgi:hypothetical protein